MLHQNTIFKTGTAQMPPWESVLCISLILVFCTFLEITLRSIPQLSQEWRAVTSKRHSREGGNPDILPWVIENLLNPQTNSLNRSRSCLQGPVIRPSVLSSCVFFNTWKRWVSSHEQMWVNSCERCGLIFLFTQKSLAYIYARIWVTPH